MFFHFSLTDFFYKNDVWNTRPSTGETFGAFNLIREFMTHASYISTIYRHTVMA